jgi:hypothetical protein
MARIPDGTEARLLSRLLLGIDGSPVCLWRYKPFMGRLYQLCPVREDHLRGPICQPPWRSFVHWLGSMDCFWLVKRRQLGMNSPASRWLSLGDSKGDPTVGDLTVGSDPMHRTLIEEKTRNGIQSTARTARRHLAESDLTEDEWIDFSTWHHTAGFVTSISVRASGTGNACDIKLEVCSSPKRQSFRRIGAFLFSSEGKSGDWQVNFSGSSAILD